MSEPNGDKRSVATDALETLGMVIDAAQKRDAIHLAVEPVTAGEKLYPGDHVGLQAGMAFRAIAPGALGIVDPFLKGPVFDGQRFWLVIYPRQIHSLRHVWTHPAFPDAPELADLKPHLDRKAASEKWLRNFIDNADCPGYETVLAAAVNFHSGVNRGYTDCYNDGEYLHFGGKDAHGDIPPEFWDHLEVVTGKPIKSRPAHFSCSC